MKSSIALKQSLGVQGGAKNISSLPKELALPWQKYSSITPLEQVGRRIKNIFYGILGRSVTLPSDKVRVSTHLHADIHQKFQNVSYLDGLESITGGAIMTNDSAIADFLAIVGIHRASRIFLSEEAQVRITDLTPQELIDIQRHLRMVLLQLKKLSHGSGRVTKRKNGALAFSHWFEAGYLYLLYDPRPSIEGLYQVLCHDIYEDPQWYISSLSRSDGRHDQKLETVGSGTASALAMRIRRLIGPAGSTAVSQYFTKPPVTFTKNEISHFGGRVTIPVYEDTLGTYGVSAANEYLKHKSPEDYALGQIKRNNEFIKKIIALPTRDFLKKMPDILSNLRTLDAFVFMENTEEGKIRGRMKMLRKLKEVCELYLPRLQEIGESGYAYLILIQREIQGLDTAFKLGLNEVYPNFLKVSLAQEREILARQGIKFEDLMRRPLANGRTTQHKSLELIV